MTIQQKRMNGTVDADVNIKFLSHEYVESSNNLKPISRIWDNLQKVKQ